MSIFSAFNNLSTKVNNAFSNIRSVSNTINNVSSNINRAASTIRNFDTSGGLAGTLSQVSTIAGSLRNTVGAVDNLINRGNSLANVGSAIRMIGNASQGVGYNAAPRSRQLSRAVLSANISSADASDWRVSISVPEIFIAGPNAGQILSPLAGTGNRMIFPFTPTVLIGHSANYSQVHPLHTNFPYNAYENSQVDNYTITGEYLNETTEDAQYFIACVHFLRTATKMFYGDSGQEALLGQPPVVCRLNGYGPHVLNNIPVLITNFTTDLPADVDYIKTVVDGKENYVPAQATITVTLAPQYARRSQARFSLTDYASGRHIGQDEGFV
jgi:hypothetical protein